MLAVRFDFLYREIKALIKHGILKFNVDKGPINI
jgi:hypothetical protein